MTVADAVTLADTVSVGRDDDVFTTEWPWKVTIDLPAPTSRGTGLCGRPEGSLRGATGGRAVIR